MHHRNATISVLATLAAIGLAIFALGCERREQAGSTAKPAFAVCQASGSGPYSVTISASSTSLTVADRLTLLVEQTVPSGVQPVWPAQLDAIDSFTLADKADSSAAAPDGTVYARRLTLEPFLPGDPTIPSLMFEWPGAPKPAVTGPIKIHVASLLPAGAAGSSAMAAPLPPIALERRGVGVRVWLAATSLVLVGGTATFWLVWRRRREAVSIDPVSRARSSLLALRAALTIDGSRPSLTPTISPTAAVHGLADILREYLAAHLGLPARELTPTELMVHPGAAARLGPAGFLVLSGLMARLDNARFAPDSSMDTTGILRALDDVASLVDSTAVISDAASGPKEAAA